MEANLRHSLCLVGRDSGERRACATCMSPVSPPTCPLKCHPHCHSVITNVIQTDSSNCHLKRISCGHSNCHKPNCHLKCHLSVIECSQCHAARDRRWEGAHSFLTADVRSSDNFVILCYRQTNTLATRTTQIIIIIIRL